MKLSKRIANIIVHAFSVQKNEFRCISESSNKIEYENSRIEGYRITIEKELEDHEDTGRYLVTHTQHNGKIYYYDIWEVKNNQPMFVCRDTMESVKKKNDVDYVKELIQKGEELQEKYDKLVDRNKELQENYDELVCKKRYCKEAALQEKGKRRKRRKGRPNIDEEIEESILSDCDAGMAKTEIAKKYQVERKTIYNILARRRMSK